MRVNPVCSANYGVSKVSKNQPSFGAVFLNMATIKDSAGMPKEVAIVAAETEHRELSADLRLKHRNDVSEEEFNDMVSKKRTQILEEIEKIIDAPYEKMREIVGRIREEISGYISIAKLFAMIMYEPQIKEAVEEANKEAEKNKEINDKLYFETLQKTLPETNFAEVLVMDDLAKKNGDDIYKGDFELMQKLAEDDYMAEEVNNRVKEMYLMNADKSNITTMGKYLKAATNGKRDVMPKGGYGMLKREYGEAVSYWPDTEDNAIWYDPVSEKASRQIVLMAVEPHSDGNYRNLKPDEVYGMAGISTDRLTDAVGDMVSEKIDAEIERMEGLKKADKEFDELFQKYKDTGATDKNMRKQLSEMGLKISRKYNIVWGDFMGLTGKGKESYIIDDVPDYVTRKAMKKFDLPEENVRPVNIWKLFSTNIHFDGAEKALLDTIIDKAKVCGITAHSWISDAINHCKEFMPVSGSDGKIYMEGFIKSAVKK